MRSYAAATMGQGQVRAAPPQLQPQMGGRVTSPTLGPGGTAGPGYRARLERRAAGTLLVLIVAVLLIIVFAGALAEANELNARAAAARQQTLELKLQVEAGRREIVAIQTDAFLSLLARAFGMGDVVEHPFGLRPGAPPPRAIVPLGTTPDPIEASTPLDDWLDLLLGR